MLENKIQPPVLIQNLGSLFPTKTSKKKIIFGIYRCFCGNEFKTSSASVMSGHTKSCGCYFLKKITKHNLSNHRLYNTWSNMINRTTNKKFEFYADYGGRGIKVCERWKNIANFIEDMADSFVDGLTLDRKDVNGDYEKSNCRWVSQKIQSRNTRIIQKNNTSGYRGVTFYKPSNKWRARVRVDNKEIFLGLFSDPKDASNAYNEYIEKNKLEHNYKQKERQ